MNSILTATARELSNVLDGIATPGSVHAKGDDAMTYAIYQTRDGKESKVLELSFTRQKGISR
jgi:hypothetical protein